MARGNFTTGAERYNMRMRKIFDRYQESKIKESKMSYKELIADGYSKETARHIIRERLKNKKELKEMEKASKHFVKMKKKYKNYYKNPEHRKELFGYD